MATVQLIIDRVQPIIGQVFQTSKPAGFTIADACVWLKDAYDIVGTQLRTPRATASINAAINVRQIALPADILHGIEGIISLQHSGVPLGLWDLQSIQRLYGDSWTTPLDMSGVNYYFTEDDETKVSVLSAPSVTAVGAFTLVYVQSVPVPANFGVTIPVPLERFIPIFPLYLVGRATEKDDLSKGSAFIQEFEARVRGERIEKKRRVGKRVVPETYSLGINNYINNYGRSGRRGPQQKPLW